MITRYALIAALLAAIAGGGWITLLQIENSRLSAKNDHLSAQLETCGARIKNIVEDQADDATVNDPGDFDIPDGWLFDPALGGD